MGKVPTEEERKGDEGAFHKYLGGRGSDQNYHHLINSFNAQDLDPSLYC